MPDTTSLIGLRFGKLFVISFSHSKYYARKARQKTGGAVITYWKCRCDCGEETVAARQSLKDGTTLSCGCLKYTARKTHGMTSGGSAHYNKTYRAWDAMTQRCTNHNHIAYKYYGGRGITICKRWRRFKNFLHDMGEKPDTALSLARIRKNEGYRPSNVIWANKKIQSANMRNCVKLTAFGRTQHLREWAREMHLSVDTIRYRMRVNGMSAEEALLKPGRHHGGGAQS